MKALICENCQGNQFVKESGLLACQFCGTKFVPDHTPPPLAANPALPEHVVFARWRDGFFYPGVAGEWVNGQRMIAFLDGDTGLAAQHDILPLEDALARLELQGNWQHLGMFFRGSLGSRSPLVMHYNDGDVEQIQLRQLRGAMPGEKRVGLFSRLMGW